MNKQSSERAMTADEARKQLHKGFMVETTSGIKFEVRRLSPMDYIREGISDIPSEFYQFVTDLQKGKLDFKEDKNQLKKNFDLFEKFITITIDHGVIAPPLMFKLDEKKVKTHLLYAELPTEDQVLLIDAITGR